MCDKVSSLVLLEGSNDIDTEINLNLFRGTESATYRQLLLNL